MVGGKYKGGKVGKEKGRNKKKEKRGKWGVVEGFMEVKDKSGVGGWKKKIGFLVYLCKGK